MRDPARSLGDKGNQDDTHTITHLTEVVGCIQWHRLLFARFLLSAMFCATSTTTWSPLPIAATKPSAPAAAMNGPSPERHRARLPSPE